MGFWSGVRDGFVGAAKGTWDGVKGLAKGGYDLATDPAARERAWEATKSAGNAVAEYAGDSWDDPAKPFRDARDGANAAYNAADKFVRTADAEDWGKLAGAGVFEVGTALVPVGAVAKAGKLGKLGTIAKTADKVGDVADTATDAAKLVDKATDAAKLADKVEDTADAVDDAVDAAKLLDDKAPASKKKCVDVEKKGNHEPKSPAPKKTPHKNSRDYQGESHVYDIKAPDGSVHKVGKSSTGTRLDGQSKRAEAQVRKLNRDDIANGGVGGYESNIRKTFDSSGKALDHEKALRDRYRRMFGEDLLPGNREHLRGRRRN